MKQNTHTHTHSHTRTRTHTHLHTLKHTLTHTHTYTHTHSHTHRRFRDAGIQRVGRENCATTVDETVNQQSICTGWVLSFFNGRYIRVRLFASRQSQAGRASIKTHGFTSSYFHHGETDAHTRTRTHGKSGQPHS